jgi:hypothetical protein
MYELKRLRTLDHDDDAASDSELLKAESP